MDFGLLPPDVNSGLMYTGPGAGPMLAAAASWDEVAAGLEAAASAYSTEIAELTVQWIGPSSMLMAAAAARHLAWLQLVAAQAVQTAAQAYTAAAAYEAAYAMTVPPPLVAANRMQLMVLIATNFFGQNTAAIAATEAEYMEMWIQDATAMYGYAAVAETASALESFEEPQQTTNPAGQEDQSNAVARSTADTARARTQSGIQQLSSTATTTENLAPGETVNVAPGGATVDNWVEITVTNGYPVSFSAGQTFVVGPNGPIAGTFSDGTPFSFPANFNAAFNFNGVVSSGTFTPLPSGPGQPVPAFPVSIASGSIVTGSNGVVAELDASGAVTAITWGSVTTAPAAVTPVVPVVPGASGAVAAAPAAASPGLAGTAGIEPQFSVEGLAEWAQGLSRADLAAASRK